MALIKFDKEHLDKLSDRLETCLEDHKGLIFFEMYLANIEHTSRKTQFVNILKLWKAANKGDLDGIDDLMIDVDNFDDTPFLTISEPSAKQQFIKMECCKLFNKFDIHRLFINYLRRHHAL